MPKMVNCSVVKKLMVLGKWPYLMVVGQMTLSLGCLPAASQLAGAVNGRKANEDVCRSSINYFWGLYFIAVNGRKGKRDF